MAALTVSVADIELLRGQIGPLRAERDRTKAEREAAEAVYRPFVMAALNASNAYTRADAALRKWDNGGPLHFQTVAGICRRWGLVHRGAGKADSFSTEQMGSYTVAVHVSAKHAENWSLFNEETKKAQRENSATLALRVVSMLDRAGYSCRVPEETPSTIYVRRGPTLAAKSRVEQGITAESILAESGLGGEA